MCTVSKKPRARAHPVSTSQLPVVRCQMCQQTMAHQPEPGAAASVLTKHYNDEHAAELAASSA